MREKQDFNHLQKSEAANPKSQIKTVSDNDKLQKKLPEAVKEKTQYALAFSVIATMLFVAGFPMFIIIFFGIFAYFLWRTFAAPSPSGTREVFEFYLAANEILRDDERRWFGFEIQETIARGERVLQFMNGAPPLVYFTLGALYNKVGDHQSAVSHLAYVSENENADEQKYLYASPELKNYVRILRKIEREPAEAPQTSAAVRALERARRNRSKALLEESRAVVKEQERKKLEIPVAADNATSADRNRHSLAEAAADNARKIPESVTSFTEDEPLNEVIEQPRQREYEHHLQSQQPSSVIAEELQAVNGDKDKNGNGNGAKKQKGKRESFSAHRPPISEVLRDIYDEK